MRITCMYLYLYVLWNGVWYQPATSNSQERVATSNVDKSNDNTCFLSSWFWTPRRWQQKISLNTKLNKCCFLLIVVVVEPTKKHQGETNIRVVSSRRRQEAGGRLFEDKTVQEAGCMWSTTSSSRVLVVVVVVVGSRVVVVEGRRQLACGDHPWHTSSNHNQHSLLEGKRGKMEKKKIK